MNATAPETMVLDELQTEELLAECRQAICATFFEVAGRMDIRHLWSRGRLHYFRVNWWQRLSADGVQQAIQRSAFIEVRETQNAFVVRERTDRAAA